MALNHAFGKGLAPLAAFAAGAVVTAALAGSRRRPAPPPDAVQAAVDTRPAPAPSLAPIAPPPAPLAAPPPVPLAAPPPVSRPTSPPPPPTAAPLDERQADRDIAEQMQRLRDEVTRMQWDLATARANPQMAILRDLDRHVVGVREELAQHEANRAAEGEVEQEAAQRRQEAVETLIAAQSRLALGDSEVLDQLDAASPALPLPAQAAIRNARAQLASKDLYAARSWLALAIAASIRTQLEK